ncbi:hypothetical protein BO85DRAFT_262690 [Aspergillus piperis CBS 112811]|uniref:Uncharacterized protein n=1 Tax=Aspergillus piperis CBS 112811 TaxID=1448313 RepID=A0A8G1R6J0_9EURO|nr:hypothetical protein BO85DRAFT_262690 [Aspergillus piperis CBS 112811]RAH59174.1 hypothetical protein BO85DRAFT_262690 [Aspergillus piperis CBS 112811]
MYVKGKPMPALPGLLRPPIRRFSALQDIPRSNLSITQSAGAKLCMPYLHSTCRHEEPEKRRPENKKKQKMSGCRWKALNPREERCVICPLTSSQQGPLNVN